MPGRLARILPKHHIGAAGEDKKVELQCIRDEEGGLLRDKGRIRERWVRFFHLLLNAKSDKLNPTS